MSDADLGFTHVALPVSDLDASLVFYERYAAMTVVHRRTGHHGEGVAWISDLTRPFVVVLIETAVTHTLGGWSHLGVGLASRAEVDGHLDAARAEGREVSGPHDDGPPVGYWGIIADPDGHHLEVAFGQEVRLAVSDAATAHRSAPPPQ